MNKKQKALVIFSAIIILGGLFVYLRQPKTKTETMKDAIHRYKMPADFTAADIEAMVKKMQKDPEFKFYFQILDQSQRQIAVNETAEIILETDSSEAFLKKLKEEYERVRALASAFYLMEFPEDFVERPARYPQFEKMMLNFVLKEFKLAIMGVYYKVHHDQYFMFQWDSTTVMAAKKLRHIWETREDYLNEQKLK